jgi:predicted dehydrogenase
MPIALGLIGAGTIGGVHADKAARLGLDLVAVADPDLAAAETLAKRHGFARSCSDFREVVADPRIDAVVIASPNGLHGEQAIAALEAGKHVLLEKPMAATLSDARRIAEAQRRGGTVLQLGMANRYKAAPQSLLRFARGGQCGDFYTGQAFWLRRRGIPGFGGWATTRELAGGGAVLDIGVHVLDLALHLMGFPRAVAVSAAAYNVWSELEHYTYTWMWGRPRPGGRKDVEDCAMALVRFEDGQTLQLSISWAINAAMPGPDAGIRLMGDRGGIELRGFDGAHFYGEMAGSVIDAQPHLPAVDDFLEQLRAFVAACTGAAAPVATADEGLAVQGILDAIYRSAEERREVSVVESALAQAASAVR